MGALARPTEALLLSAQGEAWQGTATASEAGLKRGLTSTTVEAGRAAGASTMVAGKDQEIKGAHPRREGQREEPPRTKVHGRNQFQCKPGYMYLDRAMQCFSLAPRRLDYN